MAAVLGCKISGSTLPMSVIGPGSKVARAELDKGEPAVCRLEGPAGRNSQSI